ncbi:type II toxin-antitoxin system death-on-curing family toxin [Methanococcoides burtonii]|nr:type II toxin-antitoxin system death-on-curing family toxin [Methanococcoides burtonii]
MSNRDVNKIIQIHDFIIELDKAINPDDYLPGIHDIGVLEGLFEWRVSNDNSPIRNAALILDSITRRHAFNNGNKRTGFAVASILLESKGYRITANSKERLDFLVSIAKYQMEVEDTELWLTANSHHIGKLRFKIDLLFRKTRFGLYLQVWNLFKICCPKPNDNGGNINKK